MKSFRLTVLAAAVLLGFAWVTQEINWQAASVILISCAVGDLMTMPSRRAHSRR